MSEILLSNVIDYIEDDDIICRIMCQIGEKKLKGINKDYIFKEVYDGCCNFFENVLKGMLKCPEQDILRYEYFFMKTFHWFTDSPYYNLLVDVIKKHPIAVKWICNYILKNKKRCSCSYVCTYSENENNHTCRCREHHKSDCIFYLEYNQNSNFPDKCTTFDEFSSKIWNITCFLIENYNFIYHENYFKSIFQLTNLINENTYNLMKSCEKREIPFTIYPLFISHLPFYSSKKHSQSSRNIKNKD